MSNFKRGSCLVTGSNGMVGSAIKKLLSDYDILSPTRAELDLGDRQQVRSYFEKHRPEYVFMIIDFASQKSLSAEKISRKINTKV